MTETKAIRKIDIQALESSGDPEVQIQAFEARQKVLQHALNTGIKATNAGDWKNLGGAPYLQGSGAEKMLPCLPGIQITDVSETCQEHEDAKGRYFTYVCKGKVSFHSTMLEVVGRASSRDSFFFKTKTGERQLEEINRNDIAGSAYTDMIRNALVRMFGLRNLTWEYLEKYGIRQGDVGKVDYKRKQPTPGSSTIDQRKRKMFAVLCEYFTKNPDEEHPDPAAAAGAFVHGILGKPYKAVSTEADVNQVSEAFKELSEGTVL